MTWDSDCGPTGRGATGSRRGDGRRADPDGDAPWGDSHTPSASVRTVRSSDEASRESCETGRIHAQPACACAPNHRRGPGGLQDRRRLAGPTAHTATAHIPKTIHTNKGQTRSALAGPGGRGDETRRAAAHRTTHVPHWQRRLQGRSQRARARRDTLTRIHAGYTCATVGWLARLPLSSLTDVTQISPPLPSCATIAPE